MSNLAAINVGLQVAPMIKQAVITFAVAEYIEKAGDAPAQLERAHHILEITQSLMAINSGSVDGLAGVQTAFLSLSKAVHNEPVLLAVNGLFADVLVKLQSFNSNGLIGKVLGLAANDFLQYAVSTAETYVHQLSAATPAA